MYLPMNEAYELLKSYIPVKSVLKARYNDGMLIASNKNSEIYYLNDMAGEIWKMIDGKFSLEDLSSKILAEYDADSEQVNADMVNLIRSLQWKKLIRLREGRNNHEEI